MDNHVHLLLTPVACGAIATLMQRIGRSYVSTFNARHGRTGTRWEGRYKACLVDSDRYLLACSRYIDLNPIRARMIDDPAAYRWSSCAALCGQVESALLTPHPTQLALETDAAERGRSDRALLDAAIVPDELIAIRHDLQQQRALGRDDSRAIVEA